MAIQYTHLSETHKKESVKALENKLYHDFITGEVGRLKNP